MSDAPYTEPCDGSCGSSEPHNAHLTPAGHERYHGVPEGQNLFYASKDIQQVLGHLAGYASVCWKEGRIHGKYSVETVKVFDSEKAAFAVDQAYARIEELLLEKGFMDPTNPDYQPTPEDDSAPTQAEEELDEFLSDPESAGDDEESDDSDEDPEEESDETEEKSR